MVTRRTTKTLTYRISTITIVQIASWIIFQNIVVNIGVGISEIIRMSWYYIFDWFFEEKLWRKKNERH